MASSKSNEIKVKQTKRTKQCIYYKKLIGIIETILQIFFTLVVTVSITITVNAYTDN